MGINYEEIAAAGGLAKKTYKTQKEIKKEKGEIGRVPLEVKEESIKLHGPYCLGGECQICGGALISALKDEPHHFPHKGPHSTPNKPEYIWMACHDGHQYYQEHPDEEEELFKRIAAKGIKVIWKVPRKGIGNR